MRAVSDPSRRIVISVDMANYSRRNNVLQYKAQEEFRSIMDQAAEELAVNRPAWLQQQAGDGELAILPADASERALVAKLTPTLDKLLRQHNMGRSADGRIRLRVAMHQGLVHLDGRNGYPGEAVVTVCRLVDSPVVKDALGRRYPRADVALIVSDQMYNDVVCQYHDLRPDLFQKVRAELPDKGFAQPAWLYVPNENAGGSEETSKEPLPDDDSPPRRATPSSRPTQRWDHNKASAPAIFGNDGTQNFGREPRQ